MVSRSLRILPNIKKRVCIFFDFLSIQSVLLWVLLAGVVSVLNAQDKNNPWFIGLGINFIDVYPAGNNPNGAFGNQGAFLDEFFNFDDHWNMGWPSLSLSRRVIESVSLGVEGSFNTLTKIEGDAEAKYPFFSYNGFARWHPLSDNKITPYLKVGYGISRIDLSNRSDLSVRGNPTISMGLGGRIMISEMLGVSIQSNFKAQQSGIKAKFFEHQVSLNYIFGSFDQDKDGIPDKNDACPEIFGIEKFNGCPDTDGDGIPDAKDECPEVPGVADLKGCIDTDEDGVMDGDDECPEVFGSVDLKGCPDEDGDGIADNDEDTAGNINDLGVNLANSLNENNAVDKGLVDALNKVADGIVFMGGSDVILGKKNINTLEKVKNILNTYPESTLVIEGYSSSDGSEELNMELSMRRALTVKNYLVKRGIPEYRLEVVAKGEENPVGKNETIRGRVINRRVQFKLKAASSSD